MKLAAVVAAWFVALFASIAIGQSITPGVTVDTSGLATKAEMTAALAAVATKADIQAATTPLATKGDVSAVQAAIPQPASAVPPAEMTGGSVGTAGTYRPADARNPRITRSRTLTLAADGTATFDWTAQGSLVAPVQVVIGPIFPNTGGVPKCWTVTASATAATIKCVTETVALLSVVGINIGSVTNSAPAGMQVGVVVLPAS